jgi:hypothetical protein
MEKIAHKERSSRDPQDSPPTGPQSLVYPEFGTPPKIRTERMIYWDTTVTRAL